MRTDRDEDKGLNRIMWPLSRENNGTGNYQVKNYENYHCQVTAGFFFTLVVEDKIVITSDDRFFFHLRCMSLLPHCDAVMMTPMIFQCK